MDIKRIAFIGLGAMGAPIAGHLADKGYDMVIHNRSPAKMDDWLTHHKGQAAATIQEAVYDVDGLITCIGTDDELEEIVTTALPIMGGGFIIDHSTTSARLARAMAQEAHNHGHRHEHGHGAFFCDAPVSGGTEGAEQALLSIMVGAEEERHLSIIMPLLQCYGRTITHMGAVGTGQLTKMVNQICVSGLLQGLAEGLHFAQKANLDSKKLLKAIGGGAASSWQMTHRAPTMMKKEFDFGFKVDWMIKDLQLALEEANDDASFLAITQTILGYYKEIQTMGGGSWDSSSLIARLSSADG